MGMLVDGVWKDVWYDTSKSGGRFVRTESAFRDHVSAAPDARFRAEAGRYHLYVSLACPWAHRAIIARALKGLERAIGMSVVDPFMAENGWTFSTRPGAIPDPVFHAQKLHEIYRRARADYTGRVTVPVLWDRREQTIVNNESSEILRMLDSAFDAFATRELPSLYPEALRPEIDALNARVYDTVNNGVYKCGFAGSQRAYDEAIGPLFDTLDALDERLADGRRFLFGDDLTEADVRLFTTLVRFDAVYHGHFKCNLRRLVDYPNLWRYARRIYQLPHVAGTVDFDHIKEHYYRSHVTINPSRIVPRGPIVDWDAPA